MQEMHVISARNFSNMELKEFIKEIDFHLNDGWHKDEDAPDFVQELRDAAVNIMEENPGIGEEEWMDALMRQYPAEVVDAFGTDEEEVCRHLQDLWEAEFFR